jgi:hypothetical protein
MEGPWFYCARHQADKKWRVFLAGMEGVSRVERVQGPYDFVIHAAGPAQVEVIERLPGVTAADVCWLSPRSQGGSG